jgi:transposase
MNREDFQTIYNQGPEAILTVIERLETTIRVLSERVVELENQGAKNSRNSGKPPSSDGLRKAPKSLRTKSGKKAGGQRGHEGTTLKRVVDPDAVVMHEVGTCEHCGTSLEEVKSESVECRQVFDLPPMKVWVTEHRAERKGCPCCGGETVGEFPVGVTSGVQYGEGIKAAATYLMTGHLLPVERTAEILKDVFGCSPAVGTVAEMMATCADEVTDAVAGIKRAVSRAAVVNFDETGFRVAGKLHWLHVAGTPDLTFYAVDPKRGKAAIEAVGILPGFKGVAVHDAYASYLAYESGHALCNAHLLRDLIFVAERMNQAWAAEFVTLLLEIKTAVETARTQGEAALAPKVLAEFEARYATWLAVGFALPVNAPPPPSGRRPKQSPSKNLLDRLTRHQSFVLAFMYDFRVPFDNNQAERDLRMMKLKQKVSGGFRTLAGAAAFASVRSYISTLKKQGRDVLAALKSVFAGCPVNPLPTG